MNTLKREGTSLGRWTLVVGLVLVAVGANVADGLSTFSLLGACGIWIIGSACGYILTAPRR